MPAPKKKTGTLSPRTVADGGGGPRHVPRNPPRNGPRAAAQGGRPNANSKGNQAKGGKGKGNKKKQNGKSAYKHDMEPLNPPFDRRMRRIGSPLNGSSTMKRGWVQTKDDNLRVNFMYNPSDMVIQHQTSDDYQTTEQKPTEDNMDAYYAAMGSSTGVKLLYDRTYELYNGGSSFAARFGVYADVAAWYVLMGMMETMPTSWTNTLLTGPPQPKEAFLFIGPRMVFNGRISGLSVTYSHWNQFMVPARCAVDLNFELLPFNDATEDVPLRGKVDTTKNPEMDWFSSGHQVPDALP